MVEISNQKAAYHLKIATGRGGHRNSGFCAMGVGGRWFQRAASLASASAGIVRSLLIQYGLQFGQMTFILFGIILNVLGRLFGNVVGDQA